MRRKRNKSRQEIGRWVRAALIVGACGLVLWPAVGAAAEKKKVDAAEVSVDGAGILRDRELKAALKRLLAVEARETVDANAIEDAAVILTSALGEEGFQSPSVEIEVVLEDGAQRRFTFDPTFENPLPRPLSARGVKFRLKPGVRSHVAKVEITGLSAIALKPARAFFRTDAMLVATAKTNAYSPSKVQRAADGLLGELRQRGYAESEVKAEKVAEATDGAATVRVEVTEGPRWVVDGVRYIRDEGDAVKLPDVEPWAGRPWSPTLQEDIRESVRQAYYREGFPDIGVHVEVEPQPPVDGVRHANVTTTIVPGARVTVGEVRIVGNRVTRENVLRRRVRLEAGDPLNPVALERARYRISRLGVFESVDLQYEPTDGEVRNPVFTVREGPRYETHLLFGYGSYEQLRAGIEHRQMNIFGLAHQSRLELVQSMKSTSLDYRYTVPELFGESLDGTARLFGLQREEIAFLRQEYGVDISMKRRVWQIPGGEASVGYTYGAFRNRENALATEATDERQINVAAVTFGLAGDRRDNPLRPRHGYHWSTQLEAAAPQLGGEATYQRFEISGAYHTGWGDAKWIHVGLSQGVITTLGSDDRTLPVNKRFFPGGDNSIRGYQRGEAAPRAADGSFIGAKTYVLLNLELERALTPSWSVVAFADALGTAVALRDLPFEERRYSVGLGVRYNTLIGPVRLEYGRNINRRPNDPSGTWHVSIGYPF